MDRRLIQVTAPHFCAGLLVSRTHVVYAAPILKWTEGRRLTELGRYFRSKGWQYREIKDAVGDPEK